MSSGQAPRHDEVHLASPYIDWRDIVVQRAQRRMACGVNLPIVLIAVAPGRGLSGDFAILETVSGTLRKVRRSTPTRKLKNMLKCFGIADGDPRSDAFVEMVRAGRPVETW